MSAILFLKSEYILLIKLNKLMVPIEKGRPRRPRIQFENISLRNFSSQLDSRTVIKCVIIINI